MDQETTDDVLLGKANQIMDEAVEKAGELLSTKPQIAEVILKQLLRCDPEHQGGLQLMGLCKHRLGQHAEAIEVIQTVLELDPTNADNWNNLALAYGGLLNHEKAIEALEKAIEFKPEQFLYKNNLALQYRAIGEYDKAVDTLKAAIEACPRPQLWLNLGGIYGEIKDLDNAEQCFKEALSLDPEYPPGYVDLAFIYHLRGDWKKGFAAYEWRFWYYPQMKYYLKAYDMTKVWDGSADLNGKRVLIYGEQGLGDIIQFSRFAKQLKDRGAYVIVHCPANLDSVIKRVDGVDETTNKDIVNENDEKFPSYDYQFSMMSFPYLLNVQEISGKPYIQPVTSAFRDYVEEDYGDTFNVGIVWAGSPAHPHDKKRSIPLKQFKPLYETFGVKLFSLQMELSKRQYGATYRCLNEAPDKEDILADQFHPEQGVVDYCEDCDDMRLVDLTKMIQSFEDTCTILAGLDLVICCDTAVAHMAGAMGVPVWVVLPYNPDWRWEITGDTTMWYDSMRLFRQEERDNWDEVFARIQKELWDKVVSRVQKELHETVLSHQRQEL